MGSMTGGSSTSSKWSPPDYAVGPWKDLITQAQGIAGDKSNFAPYAGQTVAGMTPQMGGMLQEINDFALQGSPERSASGAAILNATQGNMNPYATAMNPYMGDNPYMQSMLANSNDLIAKNFAKGTAAQTDAAAARSGAMGGSAYNENVQDNDRTLGGLLASNTNNLLSQQYNNSQNLAENALNRATGAYDQTQNRALQGAQLGIQQQAGDLAAMQGGLQAAGVGQNYAQQLLNAAQNYYQQGQQANITPLNLLQSILGSASGGFGQGTQIGPAASPLTAGLAGGSLLYGLNPGGIFGK